MQDFPSWLVMVLIVTVFALLPGAYYLICLWLKLEPAVTESLGEAFEAVRREGSAARPEPEAYPNNLQMLCPHREMVSPSWRIVYAYDEDGGPGQWEAWNQKLETMPADEYGTSYRWLFRVARHPIPVQYDGMIAMLQRWQANHDCGPVLADFLEERWGDCPRGLLDDLRSPPQPPLPT